MSDPYTGPRDTPGEDDGQPITEPYDDRGLPRQPQFVNGEKCHCCPEHTTRVPGSRRGLLCPICDAPPIKE